MRRFAGSHSGSELIRIDDAKDGKKLETSFLHRLECLFFASAF